MKTTTWLQITAGQGPKECGWVATNIAIKILSFARKSNITADIVEYLPFDKMKPIKQGLLPNACRSIVIRIEVDKENEQLSEWLGSILWKGNSPFRPTCKRTNWFVGVVAIPPATATGVTLNTLRKDIVVDTMKSSGPGGQHVNKTDSAVRVTHIPTGVKVRVDADRSQHRNRIIALERLQLILAGKKNKEQGELDRNRWLSHCQVERGNAKKVFMGADFKECKES